MAHAVNPEADALLDKEFPVLDHGFVRLVDYLGGDDRIVQSARVSYGKGTKTVREDKGLIDYLMRHLHTSPFEQVILSFHLKMPIFVARQWVRHRTARMNEISGRYSVMRDEFYVPPAGAVHFQSKTNKQGRDEETPVPAEVVESVRETLAGENRETYASYEKMLEDGISRELARINLPLSLYTEFYWQMDLHNLFHFLNLRLDAHAQLEIRLYAEVIANIVKTVAPYAYESFERNIRYGRRFSSDEIEEIKRLAAGEEPQLTGRKLREFREKLGLPAD
ncbi:MAG: FAD-dependent thymidylate synthase [Deltaproteobacteria bacterium]|nr:FAD-dependent thymidylate synthase [Deltaproteobacteria bacterium]